MEFLQSTFAKIIALLILLFALYLIFDTAKQIYNQNTTKDLVLSKDKIWLDRKLADYEYHVEKIKDLKYRMTFELDFIEKLNISSMLSSSMNECNDIVSDYNKMKPNDVKPLKECIE